MDVAHWLRDLGLERYEAAFRANDVNAQLLPNLTAATSRISASPQSAIAATPGSNRGAADQRPAGC